MKNIPPLHLRLKLKLAGISLLGLIVLACLTACGETGSPTPTPQTAATVTPALATPSATPSMTRSTVASIVPAKVTTALPTIATSPIPSNASRAAQEDDIREMIFRYTFEHSFGGKLPKIYYLSLSSTQHVKTEQKDPSDGLLKRFAGESFTVKKISEAVISNASPFVVKDKTTGENGLIYGVSDVKWLSDTEAEIEGSYYMFGMNAGGTTYKVGLENGKWMIKAAVMTWIT